MCQSKDYVYGLMTALSWTYFIIVPIQCKVKRVGNNKKQNDTQDIMNVFLKLQPESVPCFVCKDLSRLPPLSMNNFDLSGVMRSIESLKAEMELIKDTQKSTIASQIELTQHVKHQTTRPCESPVNTETRQSTHSPVRPRPRIPAHTPVRTNHSYLYVQ